MFLANVAHDLRSPLNCMKGNNDIINMSICAKDKENLSVYFKRFDDQIVYMSSIIEDIIDMAKFKHNNFMIQEELFDLRSLINDVIELLSEQTIIRNIEMKAIVQPCVP